MFQTGEYSLGYLVKRNSGVLLDFGVFGTLSQIEKYNPITNMIFRSIQVNPNYEAEIVLQKLEL